MAPQRCAGPPPGCGCFSGALSVLGSLRRRRPEPAVAPPCARACEQHVAEEAWEARSAPTPAARQCGEWRHPAQLAACAASIASCVRLLDVLSEAGFFALVVVLVLTSAWDLVRRARRASPAQQGSSGPTPSPGAAQVDALVAHFERRATWDPDARMDRSTCRRFLAARKGDMQAASAMLERYARWRASVRPAEITPSEVRREFASRKAYAHGTDRNRRGVAWVFVDRHDKSKRDLDEMRKFIPFCMERTIALSEASGTEQICIVFDLSGFGLKTMDYELVKKMIHILASFYPERLGKVLLWNGPTLFSLFWNAVKPWIDPNTVKKISFVNSSELLRHVHPDMFPKEVAERFGVDGAPPPVEK